MRFAVRPLKYRDVEQIVGEVLESRQAGAKIDAGGFALVSLVGEALRQRLDAWAAEVARILAGAEVEVHGASRDEISLSYLVREEDRRKAVEHLHQELVL